MVDFSPLMPNETKQKRQVATIELLETFTLGKNTRKNAGIKNNSVQQGAKETRHNNNWRRIVSVVAHER
jgi:hypothetical protein